jgi:hypothetical protein
MRTIRVYAYGLFVVMRTFRITSNKFLFHRRLRTRAGVSADWVAWCVHNYLPLHATLPLLPIQAVVGGGGGRDVEAAWLDIHLGLYSVRYCSYLYIQ